MNNNNPVKCTVWNLKIFEPRIQNSVQQYNPGFRITMLTVLKMSKTHLFVDIFILVSTLSYESPAGFHLHIQSSLHTTHLHILVKMAVHVRLCCGKFQLQRSRSHQTRLMDFYTYIYMYLFNITNKQIAEQYY